MRKSNENVSVAADGDNLVITFEETKHQYNIGQDGNFTENVDWSKLEPGLYKTGTSEMIKSWKELIDDGDITVEGTKLTGISFVPASAMTEDNPLDGIAKGDLIISNTITEIGNVTGVAWCYVGFTGITGIYVPSSVKKLDGDSGGSFYGMANIKKVVIEEGIDEISKNTFSCCSSLKEIILPNSVKKILGWAFERCENLKEITIPASVTDIDGNAFTGSSITKIIVKSGTSLNEDSFKNVGLADDVQIEFE